MFDNRGSLPPTLFGAQQQSQQQQLQQQQQTVLPPQYQGVDLYAQQSVHRSPPKGTATIGVQQSVAQPQFSYSPQPPHQLGQPVFEHKIIHGQTTTQSHPAPEVQYKVQNVATNAKFSFWVDWCLYIIPILFLIAILAFMGIIIAQKNKEYDSTPVQNILKTLSFNQALPPIADLVAPSPPAPSTLISHFKHKATASECPDGFTIATLGEWPGINSGCVCDKEVKDQGFCWARYGCDSISEQQSRIFQSWNGGRVCWRLTENWTKPNGVNCVEGQKLCGNICVEKTKQCPLSGLEALDYDPTASDASLSVNLQSVKIGNKWFRKSYGGIPIVQLQVVPGNGSPCLNDITTPAFESQKSYPLLKKPATGCDQNGDLSSSKVTVDSQKAEKVQEENGLTSVIKSIPQYSNYQLESDSYTLEAISRISVNQIPECQGLNSRDVDQLVEDSQDINTYRVWFSIVIFWLCVITLVIVFVFYLVRNRYFQSMNVTNIRQPKFLITLAVIIAILCIIFGALYFYNMGDDNGLRALDNKFQSYQTNNCFTDKGIAKSIDNLHRFAESQFLTINKWVCWAFQISVAFLVLLIILLIVQKSTHGDLLANPWSQKVLQNYQEFQ